ncbi:MAG: general stress protein [Candidatus Promineifilaceae bacterium]|nr:general stress protein [Candidatus Promineifilaceae bacterium]
MKTVVALFDDLTDAYDAIEDLRDAGLAAEDVSLVARDVEERYAEELDTYDEDVADGAAAGAVGGGIVGGLLGFLVGLGAFAIPGVGPVIAAGPLASALVGAGIGAAAGGLLGALIDWGVPEAEAEYYTEGVRRGGTLVAVRATDTVADRARDILYRHNPVDIEERAALWREELGWTGYDVEAEPYTADEIRTYRQRYVR